MEADNRSVLLYLTAQLFFNVLIVVRWSARKVSDECGCVSCDRKVLAARNLAQLPSAPRGDNSGRRAQVRIVVIIDIIGKP